MNLKRIIFNVSLLTTVTNYYPLKKEIVSNKLFIEVT